MSCSWAQKSVQLTSLVASTHAYVVSTILNINTARHGFSRQFVRKVAVHKEISGRTNWRQCFLMFVDAYICKCIVNIAIACSIYDIHIVAKNIAMYWYTGVLLQPYYSLQVWNWYTLKRDIELKFLLLINYWWGQPATRALNLYHVPYFETPSNTLRKSSNTLQNPCAPTRAISYYYKTISIFSLT